MDTDRTRARWSRAEFARLPSEGRRRHEVIAGERYVTIGVAELVAASAHTAVTAR